MAQNQMVKGSDSLQDNSTDDIINMLIDDLPDPPDAEQQSHKSENNI